MQVTSGNYKRFPGSLVFRRPPDKLGAGGSSNLPTAPSGAGSPAAPGGVSSSGSGSGIPPLTLERLAQAIKMAMAKEQRLGGFVVACAADNSQTIVIQNQEEQYELIYEEDCGLVKLSLVIVNPEKQIFSVFLSQLLEGLAGAEEFHRINDNSYQLYVSIYEPAVVFFDLKEADGEVHFSCNTRHHLFSFSGKGQYYEKLLRAFSSNYMLGSPGSYGIGSQSWPAYFLKILGAFRSLLAIKQAQERAELMPKVQ